jgi:hypothetical protein
VKAQVALGVVAALALAACGQVDRGSTGPPTEGPAGQGSTASSKEGLAAFLYCMQQIQYDYQPADTPAALAAEADAVVTGTIVALRPGQSYASAPDSGPDWTTSVIEVRVDQLVAGDSAVVAAGSVYIEAPTIERAPCPAPVPESYGVFFLHASEPYSGTILHEGAGRPAGARLTAPFVQGFLIEDADDELVSVWDSFETMPPAWHGLDSVEEVLEKLG